MHPAAGSSAPMSPACRRPRPIGHGGADLRRRPDPAVTPRVLDMLTRVAPRPASSSSGVVRRGTAIFCGRCCGAATASRITPTASVDLRLLVPAAMLREDRCGAAGDRGCLRAGAGLLRPPAGLRSPLLDPVLAIAGLSLVSWTRRGLTASAISRGSAPAATCGLAAGDLLMLHDGRAVRGNCGQPAALSVSSRRCSLGSMTSGLRAVSLRQALGGPSRRLRSRPARRSTIPRTSPRCIHVSRHIVPPVAEMRYAPPSGSDSAPASAISPPGGRASTVAPRLPDRSRSGASSDSVDDIDQRRNGIHLKPNSESPMPPPSVSRFADQFESGVPARAATARPRRRPAGQGRRPGLGAGRRHRRLDRRGGMLAIGIHAAHGSSPAEAASASRAGPLPPSPRFAGSTMTSRPGSRCAASCSSRSVPSAPPSTTTRTSLPDRPGFADGVQHLGPVS